MGGILTKAAAASEATTEKASLKVNEDMWMKQLGRHGEEAAARERAEDDKEDVEEEEEAENEVGILRSSRSKFISCTRCGIWSVVIFCKTFLTCSTCRRADSATDCLVTGTSV